MNEFVDFFFTVILGWVRSLARWIWSVFRSGGQTSLLPWLRLHWMGLLAFLLVGGMVIDWLVWMIRWRPYRLWGGMFRRRMPRPVPTGGPPAYSDSDLDEALPIEDEDRDAYGAQDEYDGPLEEPEQYQDETNQPNLYARPELWDAPEELEAEEAFPADASWEETPEAFEPGVLELSEPELAQEDDFAEDMDLEDQPPEEQAIEAPLIASDQASFGRPGLWPGMSWTRSRQSSEDDGERRRRGTRWLGQERRHQAVEEAAEQAVYSPEILEEPMAMEPVAPAIPPSVDATPRPIREAGRGNRKTRDGTVLTVLGAPAKRRGLRRLSDDAEEAISGLPPLMDREDGYHRPVLPPEQANQDL